ncbi:MAG: putative toxin-antitoxin system toxin component, PIN family [Deltaproteobacteria bacterium CG_4_8_14_3_um_filter_51_11]|nr:putative toxin-antitoxin system toxin component, PIN family [bacterium]OIP40877.1 MAG: putative toxin-antitoxin system toxin component, PIN family [Desulfobacteraceae bacterium CG2_30_51_40]PIP47086.1 MAG: putative toxin-antitoxin system toxin component, PIN family [Deltaproteobacteria bacterium CG23_combo_of_CG06-09_8_20_14_all_51_20]PIV98653.1 MAG: putative toxin-antitoxin system toxin component, PIN family [Deltaproteobacteria bacterium CG17_big_fil_post_rev_8_21_14_2_50_51_6]PIX18918.1 M
MTVKAVIDTNIWVSALINPFGFPAKLRNAFERGLFQPVISEPMIEEIIEVLKRPRIKDKYGITENDIQELVLLIEERSLPVLVSGSLKLCRDKDDDFIIEAAIVGEAQYLVTRDDDMKFDPTLASIVSGHGVTITTVSKFLSAITTG